MFYLFPSDPFYFYIPAHKTHCEHEYPLLIFRKEIVTLSNIEKRTDFYEKKIDIYVNCR